MILSEIEKQTDYLFIYNKEKIDVEQIVSITYTQVPVYQILDDLFQNTSFQFVMEGTYIILQSRIEPKSIFYTTGRILDSYGNPIIGASIVDEKEKHCVFSDLNGNFSIELSIASILQVSYLGYTTINKAVLPGRKYIFTIYEKAIHLDDVVVIGYGSLNKKEVTSSISHLSSKDLLNIYATNPLETIQGKISGVSISNQSPADPNSPVSVQIRGASSRSLGLEPLVVINGVPGGNLYNVNENDIESIDVLKDGAASAIYGTRGNNGVIVVTTKRGTENNLVQTSYNGQVSFNIINDRPRVLSPNEFLQYKRGYDYGHQTDWFKEITQTGFTQSHTLTLSGGNIQNQYRATLDYKNARGVDLRSKRREIGGRISLNHQSKSELYRIILNVAPRIINADQANYGVYQQAMMLNPTQPVKNPKDPTGKTYFRTVGFDTFNPVEALEINIDGQEVKFIDWDATTRFNSLPLFVNEKGLQNLNTQITIAQQINDSFSYYFQPAYNTIFSESPNKKGYAKRAYSKSIQQSLEWLANISVLSNNHCIRFTGGYSYQYFQNSGLFAENYNFTSDALTYNNLGDGSWFKNIVTNESGFNSFKNDSKLIAFWGRVCYDYCQRYLLTASLRYEGSSKFGANHKWGYFPAISAGWSLSEEAFIEKFSFINDLKIRADFGITGNQDFESYLSIPSMYGYGAITYRGELYQAWGAVTNPNSNLQWEKGINWNVGLDFSVWNRRIYGSLNYYNRQSQDLLGWYDVPAPPNLHPQTFLNVGVMVNHGIEIELNADVAKTKNFSYSIGIVTSTNENRLKSFSNDQYQAKEYQRMVHLNAPNIDDDIQELREGERIGNFFTYAYAGVDENGGWLVWNKSNTKKIPFSEAKDGDKRIVGNGLPLLNASLNNIFRYKNLDATVYFRGIFGFDIFDIHACYYGIKGVSENVLKKAYDKNNHITGVNIPCDYFIESGDHIKLDVITLGYTQKTNSKWLESIRYYISGKNLYTFSKFNGVNPQSYPINGLTPGATGDRGYYPSTIQLLAGLQILF